MSSTVFAHIAALAIVAAMLSPNMRWLRIFAMLSAISALIGLVFAGTQLVWMAWAGVAVVVTIAQLALNITRARSNWISDEERELVEHVLAVGDPKQQRRLRDLIQWSNLPAGELVMEQDQPQPPLVFIAEGTARITRDGNEVGQCAAGDFLGEMSLISGHQASATVEALEPMRVAYFDRDALMLYSRELPEIGIAFDRAINRSLAAKVARMNEAAIADDNNPDTNG